MFYCLCQQNDGAREDDTPLPSRSYTELLGGRIRGKKSHMTLKSARPRGTGMEEHSMEHAESEDALHICGCSHIENPYYVGSA